MTKTKQNITILDREIDSSRAWTRSTLSEADWLIPVSAACREEILSWLDFIRKHPLPFLLRHPNQFEMPNCQALMERIRQVLEQGAGHAVLNRLPLDEMDADEAKALVWVLCSMLGRLVPQKWDGTIDLLHKCEIRLSKYQFSVVKMDFCKRSNPKSKIVNPKLIDLYCTQLRSATYLG
ncbi:MAG TPA: hypothetical protein V6D48_25425 [Oculatellaceae cyanobacterium]